MTIPDLTYSLCLAEREMYTFTISLRTHPHYLLNKMNSAAGLEVPGFMFGATQTGVPYKYDQSALVDYNKCNGWLLDYSIPGGSLMDIYIEDSLSDSN